MSGIDFSGSKDTNKKGENNGGNGELEKIFCDKKSLVINGENIEISPLYLGEFPLMFKAIKPFVDKIGADPDWISLMVDHGEDLLEALSIASRRPREWVNNLELDNAMMLASLIFEVNADFFIRRVVPSINTMTENMKNLSARGIGVK